MDCHGAGNGWSFNSLVPDELDPRCEFVVQSRVDRLHRVPRAGLRCRAVRRPARPRRERPTAASTTPSRAPTGARSGSTGWRSARSASTPRCAAPGTARCCWSPATRPYAANRPSCSAPGLTTVAVKQSLGRYSARHKSPTVARDNDRGRRPPGARRPLRRRRRTTRATPARSRSSWPAPTTAEQYRYRPEVEIRDSRLSDLARRRLVVGLDEASSTPTSGRSDPHLPHRGRADRGHPAGAAAGAHPRHRRHGRRQARVPQPRRLGQGSDRHPHDRGRRTRRQPARRAAPSSSRPRATPASAWPSPLRSRAIAASS